VGGSGLDAGEGQEGMGKHQIEIWCSQQWSLPWVVNDAVNVLPCATCALP
jgi:hypothetical protein